MRTRVENDYLMLGMDADWQKARSTQLSSDFGTGPTLIAEFPQLTSQVNVWTRSFFASTAEYLPPEEIQEYIRSQPKRF